jgi:hypothetical protein
MPVTIEVFVGEKIKKIFTSHFCSFKHNVVSCYELIYRIRNYMGVGTVLQGISASTSGHQSSAGAAGPLSLVSGAIEGLTRLALAPPAGSNEEQADRAMSAFFGFACLNFKFPQKFRV